MINLVSFSQMAFLGLLLRNLDKWWRVGGCLSISQTKEAILGNYVPLYSKAFESSFCNILAVSIDLAVNLVMMYIEV